MGVSSYLYRMTRKLKKRLRRLGPDRENTNQKDDFDWNTYHHFYPGQLESLGKSYTQRLLAGDYEMAGGSLTQRHQVLPLHPNHRLLYETIAQLAPASVMEIGCGGGDHLHNLSLLVPGATLLGCDRSVGQLAVLKERNPALRADVFQFDATLPFSGDLPHVDCCYTQAVIMHIKLGNSHLVALANLFAIAGKHVVLMENWSRHDFLADIQFLLDKHMVPWGSAHFYFRRSPELGNRPHLMIVSSSPLDYEALTDYSSLSAGSE